jgi:hypothetical protein
MRHSVKITAPCDVVAEAVASAPDLTTDYLETDEFYQDRAIKSRLIELLVSAGLPNRAG